MRARRAWSALAVVCLLLATACQNQPPPRSTEVVAPLPPGAPNVRLAVEPDDGVGSVVQFVSAARQSLDVAMYLLSDREILNALTAAPKRGVKVRVLLEEHPYESGAGNVSAANRLKAAGIAVAWSPATFALSHDKYAVADGQVALVGTANWTHAAFTANREYLVQDADPTDVAQLAALFADDWNRTAATLTDPNLVVSPLNARSQLHALIDTAHASLDLEAEEMSDPNLEDALVGAARRGVAVRVILPRPSGGPDANATGRGRLSAGGVRVRRLGTLYVHAKTIVADQKEGFVGSENISAPSLDANREVGLRFRDPQAIATLDAAFGRDWNSSQP